MHFFQNKPNQSQNDGENRPPSPQGWRRWVWPIVLGLLAVWFLLRIPELFGGLQNSSYLTLGYSDFVTQVTRSNISSVSVRGDDLEGRLRNAIESSGALYFRATRLEGAEDSLITLLDSHNVRYEIDPVEISPILSLLIGWAPMLLIFGFLIWTAKRAQGQAGNIFGFGRSGAREYMADRPHVTFGDVAGQEASKNELSEVVDFLKEPAKYISLGARIPRGVLLIGPPGTGKTLLARAVAGEAKVAFFSLAASEFVEMFVGVGASRVRDLFSRAKSTAPSIVFIDEIDAVGRQRGAGLGGGNDEREQTLNQLLAEMDGFEQDATVIVMAATNRPDVLDPALLRPGRFDRQITVGLPDKAGRKDILDIHTRSIPLHEDVALERIASATIGFSGADLANLANEAALSAARHTKKQITMRDFTDAFDRIVLGTESPPLANEQERRTVAYHEAGHALTAVYTPEADSVLKVTIVPRGQALGVTALAPIDEKRNYPREYLIARVLVALGGRVAEELAIGEITTGAEQDLRLVTGLVRRMVANWGMSEEVGLINYGDDERQPFLGYSLSQSRPYGEGTASRIDVEVKRIIDGAYEETRKLLSGHRAELDVLANELLNEEIVAGDRVLEIAGVNDAAKRPNVIAFAQEDASDAEETPAATDTLADNTSSEEAR